MLLGDIGCNKDCCKAYTNISKPQNRSSPKRAKGSIDDEVAVLIKGYVSKKGHEGKEKRRKSAKQ